jgi:predicted RNase H-like HicB family nuclease
MRLTAVYKKTPEGYIGFVEELPGANTQAATIEEARQSLCEAVELIVETNRELSEDQIKGQDFIKEELQVAA